uniref:La-related protein 7 n=1 Tax=Chromera velia CCMP2878 TaxID=1169474 RepID=A0A0G4HZG5_9ALVE|eukprot:Cvel_9736.t1-p1 / transcript=Cvel_9736.t1 / gene=Cvel_9736 / organism=Chromera_velia_CCMP2878 / gene_product=La-related protein 7, putative / transcript_product=La-related protein 7, putative / location=Cvel_scaffold569:21862-27572(-) / protein_length=462 / sequence_SO=supercontig / SO=protein_coding / is_pseudo=false
MQTGDGSSLQGDCALVTEDLSRDERIVKQICFWLGDSNLARDTFLRNQISKSPEGYIPIEIFLKFNTMKKEKADVPAIVKALKRHGACRPRSSLKETDICGEVEMRGDCEVRRRDGKPLPEEAEMPTERTLYICRLPQVADLASRVASVCKRYGTPLFVNAPKDPETKIPRGFAFVEFASEDEMVSARDHIRSLWPQEEFGPPRGDPMLRALTKAQWLREKAKMQSQDHSEEKGKENEQAERGQKQRRQEKGKEEDDRESLTTEIDPTSKKRKAEKKPEKEEEREEQEEDRKPEKGKVEKKRKLQKRESEEEGRKEKKEEEDKEDGKGRPHSSASFSSSSSSSSSASSESFPLGVLVELSGFGLPQTPWTVRNYLEHMVNVRFVELQSKRGEGGRREGGRGEHEGRAVAVLGTSEEASVLWKEILLMKSPLGANGRLPTVRQLEGAEEKRWWAHSGKRVRLP